MLKDQLMGRFFLTNNEDVFETAKEVNLNAGFEENGVISEPTVKGAIYDKRVKSVDNFRELEDGREVAAVGAPLATGEFGVGPVADLYQTAGDLSDHDEELFGHYALIENDGGSVRVRVDPLGTYSVYYHATDSEFFVSNSLDLIARCTDNISVDRNGLLENMLFLTNLSNMTPFEDVYKLDGATVLSLEDTLSTENVGVRSQTISYDSFDDAVEKYAARINEVMSDVAKSNCNIGLTLTGGSDSRTLLAGLFANDVRPTVMCGRGHTPFDASDRDLEINMMIADKYSLDQYSINWNHDPLSVDDESREENFQRYGFHYTYRGGSANVFEELEGGISPYPDVMMLGYGTQFTNSNPWNKFDEQSEYNIQALIDDLANFDLSVVDNEEGFREYLADAILSRNDINVGETMTGSELLNTHYKLRNYSPGRFVTFLNEFTYLFSPLLTLHLQEPLYNFPSEFRSEQRFQLEVISYLQDELLDIPLHSGNRVANDPAKSKQLIDKFNLGEWIKQVPTPLEYLIRYGYYHATGKIQYKDDIMGHYSDEERDRINDFYESKIEDLDVSLNLNLPESKPNVIMNNLYLTLYGIERLTDERNGDKVE
ncbi:hypothetical protein [Natrinema salsiterrestre]|uniref:Asparagine synthase n=1 Tax=Natrinema salsiterrestre TaxID=2950540 RepID=A0A9Q4L1I5_9EURY|nr:hypothetical protein [Natrinema salsiterrestre]MDF9745869.1 hypothetical protein [Natrinema salsiterrestre]